MGYGGSISGSTGDDCNIGVYCVSRWFLDFFIIVFRNYSSSSLLISCSPKFREEVKSVDS